MKFKSNIELQAGLEDNNAVSGTTGQVLSSTGTGVEWIDQSALTDVQSNFVYFDVKNETGSTINKGKGVMAVGTDGNSGHILIDEMVADGSVEPKYFLGVLETTVANGGFARVISFGQLDQFDTRGQNGETWNDGDILWCDPDSAGDFTITEPDGPNVKIAAAIVLNAATNGKIQVRVQANEGIHDLHDTKITSQVDGDILVWNNTDSVWFNDSTLNVDYTNSEVDITGNLNVNGGQIKSNAPAMSFLTGGGAALPIRIGSLLASHSYADSGLVPTNGAYIKGDIKGGANLNVSGSGTFNGNLTIGSSSDVNQRIIWWRQNDNTANGWYVGYQDSVSNNFAILSTEVGAGFNIFTGNATLAYGIDSLGNHDFKSGTVEFGNNVTFNNNTELRWKDSGATERTIMELTNTDDLYIGGSFAGSTIFVGGGSYTERGRINDIGEWEFNTNTTFDGDITLTTGEIFLPVNKGIIGIQDAVNRDLIKINSGNDIEIGSSASSNDTLFRQTGNHIFSGNLEIGTNYITSNSKLLVAANAFHYYFGNTAVTGNLYIGASGSSGNIIPQQNIVSGYNITANNFIGDGSQLTNIAQGALPSNVAYTDIDNDFSTKQTIITNSGATGLILRTDDAVGGNNAPFLTFKNTLLTQNLRMGTGGNLELYNNAHASNTLSISQTGFITSQDGATFGGKVTLGGTAADRLDFTRSGFDTMRFRVTDGSLQLYNVTDAKIHQRWEANGDTTFTGGDVKIDDGVGRITFQIDSGQNNIFSTTTGFGSYEDLQIRGNNLIFTTGNSGNATFNNDVVVGGALRVGDWDGVGNSIRVGDGNDFYIYHDGSDNWFQSNNGSIIHYMSSTTKKHSFYVGAAERFKIENSVVTSEIPFRVNSTTLLAGNTVISPEGPLTAQGNLHIVGETGGQGTLYISDIDNGFGATDSLLITHSGSNSFVYNRNAGGILNLGTNDDADMVQILSTGKLNARFGLNVQTIDADRRVTFKAPNGEERFSFYTGGTGNDPYLQMYGNDGTTIRSQIHSNGISYVTGSFKVNHASDGSNVGIWNYGIEFDRSDNYLRPVTNGDKNLYIGSTASGILDWNEIRLFADNKILADVGAGSFQIKSNSDAPLRVYGGNDAWSGIGFQGNAGNTGYFYHNSSGEYFQLTHKLNALKSVDITGNLDVSGTITGNGSGLTNVNADTIDIRQNNNFSGTYELVWQFEDDTLYSSDWLTVTGSTDTVNMPNLNVTTNAGVGGNLDVSGAIKSSHAVYNDINGTRLINPGGGSSNSLGNSNTVGAIKIALPQSWTSTMMRMTIKVYEYSESKSFTINCGGYNYGSSSSWKNEFAYIESQSEVDRNFTVRFGYDSNNKCCIYIGELDSVWQYPKVFVTDFQAGFNNTEGNKWDDGWSVSMETTAFENVSQTRTNCQVNNWKRNGSDLYYGSVSGNVGIGTTNPSAKLDVVGEGNFSSYLNVGSSTGIKSTGWVHLHRYASSLSVAVGNDGSNVNLYVPNGKVGIGTISPSEKLDVAGNIQVNGNYIKFNEGTNAESRIVSSANYLEIIGNGSLPASGARMWLGKGDVVDSGYYVNGSQLFFRGLDSATKMYINGTSGNVGIGTTSPSSLLHLESASSPALQIKDTTNNVTFKAYAQDSNTHLANVSNHDLFIDTNNTARITVKSSGNVGIGTTSPAGKLDVNGQVILSGDIEHYIEKDTTSLITAAAVETTTVSGRNVDLYAYDDINFRAGTGDKITMHAGGSERVRIESTGNVGIGTTSPGYKLDVAGTARITDGLRIESRSGSGNWRIYKNVWDYGYDGNQSGSVIINTAIPRNCNEMLMIHIKGYGYGNSVVIDFKVVVYPYSGSTGQDAVAGEPYNVGIVDSGNDGKPKFIGINSSGKLAIAIGDYNDVNKYYYRYTADYHSTRLGSDSYASGWTTENSLVDGFGWLHKETLNPPVTVNSSGNVGIGTTSPSEKLEVVGNIELSGNVINASNTAWYLDLDGTSVLNHGKFTSTLSFGDFSAGTRGTIFAGYSTSSVVRTDSARLDFYMGKTTTGVGTMMSLTDTGNVGIGTTSPSEKLIVNGSINSEFQSTSFTSGNKRFFADGYAAGNLARFGALSGSSIDPMSLAFYTSNSGSAGGSEKMRITDSGNVGIGTTSPSEKLEVAGNVSIDGYIQHRGDDSKFGFEGNDAFRLYTANTVRMQVNSNGNVGIGTTSPSAKLEVSGNIAVSVDNRVIFDVDSDGFNYIKSDNANSEELTFYSVGPHHFKNGEDNSYENVVASNFVLSSDERLKENTYEIQNESINVNWKTFNFKNEPEEKRYGVVAQELEKDHPEFVNTDNQGFKSVKYIDLLIAKIAELEARLEKAGI